MPWPSWGGRRSGRRQDTWSLEGSGTEARRERVRERRSEPGGVGWIGRRPTEGEEFGRRPHLRVPAGRAGLLFLAGAGGQATRALLLLVDKGQGTQDSRVPTGGDTSLLDFPLKKKLSFGFGLDLNRQTRGSMLCPTPLLYLYAPMFRYTSMFVGKLPTFFLSKTNF